jgi:hypothetical protein
MPSRATESHTSTIKMTLYAIPIHVCGHDPLRVWGEERGRISLPILILPIPVHPFWVHRRPVLWGGVFPHSCWSSELRTGYYGEVLPIVPSPHHSTRARARVMLVSTIPN